MPIYDLFSKRQKKLRGELPDVYQYDIIPQSLRIQIVHIIRDGVGDLDHYGDGPYRVYKAINDALCREYGRFRLLEAEPLRDPNPAMDVVEFLTTTDNHEEVLDVVELALRVIVNACGEYQYRNRYNPKLEPNEVVGELNDRFREHGIGYRFEGAEIVRIDSDLLHKEAVQPALRLLRGKAYQGANEEYLRAHEHYRHGRSKECLNECLKALESTLKTICEIRGWDYDKRATAKSILDVAFKNGLVPAYLQSHFSHLRQTLESGVPTIRNKMGGHGQGTVPQQVPVHLVALQLHLTASCILFLVESEHTLDA